MSYLAIRVENLSKKYVISHQRERGHHNYTALRDVITEKLTAPWRSLASRFKNAGTTKNGDGNSGSHLNSELRPPLLASALAPHEDFWALKDVCFEINQGEVVGVIGRNGAGKSTLLKILSQITEPTKGRIEIDGRVASLLEVGTGFHPELTGRENIYLNGAILGMTRAEIKRKFDEIVSFAEIEKFLDTPVKRYSSGMYVRLAFAVAAHLEPEILIVDEVLAVGDTAFQRKCLGKMGEVARQGRTILFVSHNMAAVRKLCSQALLMNHGAVDDYGPADSIILKYLARNNEESSASVDLPPGRPDSPCRGTRFECLGISGRPQAEFRLHEPWRFALEFETFESLADVIAGVGLINHESVPIVTYWSRPKDLPAGKYRVEFECKIPLKACDLQFAIGITAKDYSVYYVEGVGRVSISTIALGTQPRYVSGAGLLLSDQEPDIQAREEPTSLALGHQVILRNFSQVTPC